MDLQNCNSAKGEFLRLLLMTNFNQPQVAYFVKTVTEVEYCSHKSYLFGSTLLNGGKQPYMTFLVCFALIEV